MRVAQAEHRGVRSWALLASAAFILLLGAAGLPSHVSAQSLDIVATPSANEQMLLEADTLIYDRDRNIVTAEGNVRIEYGGVRLVADKISYDRNAAKLSASGNVEIVDADGNRTTSQYIVLSDDLRDGFVNTLRIETADKTYFAAESATRVDGNITSFNSGVYTACEPCEEDPDKAPIWRVKSRKIIWNAKEKTIRFEDARLEFFGMPIAWLPVFEAPDPTVKRKSGFLFPNVTYSSSLGVGVSVPYYLALSPTYDALVRGTYHTQQGFLGEVEWRQRFNNGQYNLKIAGIKQMNPSKFTAGTVDANATWRGMVGSKGAFKINPRWSFGWDVLVQSDKNFANTYNITGFSDDVHTSQVYLTGLSGRNYFDLRAYHFEYQETAPNSSASAFQNKLPTVLPSFDYSYTPDASIGGGELNIDVNAQGLYRDTLDATGTRIAGLSGSSGRVTAEAEWKRQLITAGGLVITPSLHARGDAIFSNIDATSIAAINAIGTPTAIRSEYYRYMATAGLEARWPVLFSTASSTNVIEPVAQIFASPNEQYAGRLGIPNEDAQSLVFDATSLFERDKFSGYDRVEGGVRANLGIRYSGTFENGWTANAIFGQRFHLAGVNSFASADLVNTGAFSGLETNVSDYVGAVGLNIGHFSTSTSARFDEKTFALRRIDLQAAQRFGPVSASARYSFVEAQPTLGYTTDRHAVTLAASTRINENWRAYGSATYDFPTNTLIEDSYGFAYDDECFSYTMTMSESRTATTATERTVGFHVSLRTLGDFGSDSGQLSLGSN